MSPELLAALAAIAAAAFSLLTLIATGRRERHRDDKLWVRSNLLDASIAYLDSSWLTRQHTRLALTSASAIDSWTHTRITDRAGSAPSLVPH